MIDEIFEEVFNIPGLQIEINQDDADDLGAFSEVGINFENALESSMDWWKEPEDE